jgi:hypothetical protein
MGSNLLFCTLPLLGKPYSVPKLTSYRGVDFDDPENGYKEEDKDPDKVYLPYLSSRKV